LLRVRRTGIRAIGSPEHEVADTTGMLNLRAKHAFRFLQDELTAGGQHPLFLQRRLVLIAFRLAGAWSAPPAWH
jgi:hypothetical protein